MSILRSTLALAVLVFATTGCEMVEVPTAPSPSPAPSKFPMPQYQVEVKLEPVDLTRVILELQPSSTRTPAQIAVDYGLTLLEEIPPLFAVLQGTYDLAALRNDPDIRHAVRNKAVQAQGSDFSFGFYEGEWEEIEGSANPQVFQNLKLGQMQIYSSGRLVRVMVGDTGVDGRHPFLVPRLEGLDPEVHFLGSWEPAPQDPAQAPAYGHGTHVAGCVAQVAPGATIIPARVLDHQGVGSLQDFVRMLAAAMDPDLDIHILSLSMSTSEPNPLVNSMVDHLYERGTIVVAAAGNYTPSSSSAPPPSPLSVHPPVFGVAAVTVEDQLAPFSRYGPDVDMAAPGVAIQSCYPGQGYTTGSGTSFATPLVAGSVALLMRYVGFDARLAATALAQGCVPMQPAGATQEGRAHPYESWADLQPPDDLHVRLQ